MTSPKESIQDKNRSSGSNIAIIATIGLLLILSTALTLYPATNLPWIGIRFTESPSGMGIIVHSVDPSGPAAGKLHQGEEIFSISNGVDTLILDPNLYRVSFLQTEYSEILPLLQLRGRLSKILQSGKVLLRTNSGRLISIATKTSRPLLSLPPDFWVMLLVGGFLVGFSTYVSYNVPTGILTTLLQVSAWSLWLVVLATSMIHFDLALPAKYLVLSAIATGLGHSIFLSTLVLIYALSPPSGIHRIRSNQLTIVVIIGIFGQALWLSHRTPYTTFLILEALFWTLLIAVLWMQWIASRQDPIYRAILHWELLWLLLPTMAVGLFVITPLGFDKTTITDPQMLLITPGMGFIGIAMGLFRYSLFSTARWWHRAITWVAGGALIIMIASLLVSFTSMPAGYSIELALLIATLLYFSFGRRLIDQTETQATGAGDQQLLDLVEQLDASDKPAAVYTRLLAILKSHFIPLKIGYRRGSETGIQLLDSGYTIRLAHPPTGGQILISGKDGGRSLFTLDDTRLTKSLVDFLTMIHEAATAAERGAAAERARIAADLHDTMGAQLLTVMHSTDDITTKRAVESCMRTLRQSVRLLSSDASTNLNSLLCDWRAEIKDYFDGTATHLDLAGFNIPNEHLNILPDRAAPTTFITKELLLELPRASRPDKAIITHIRASACSTRITLTLESFDCDQAELRKHFDMLRTAAKKNSIAMNISVSHTRTIIYAELYIEVEPSSDCITTDEMPLLTASDQP